MPIFSCVTPIFFSLTGTVIEFAISPGKWINILGKKMGIWPSKPHQNWVFGVNCPFFHVKHPFFLLELTFILNLSFFPRKKLMLKVKKWVFGVKCPFIHLWHPLFFLCLGSLLNLSYPPWQKYQHLRQNSGHLTHKTSLKYDFWGQIPIFSCMTPLLFTD